MKKNIVNNPFFMTYTIIMKREKIIKYGNPILSILLVALLGTIFTNMGLDYLDSLNKPSIWINGVLISIIWSVIYSLFAIYLLKLVKDNKLYKKLLVLLIINGLLNVLWCFIFFNLKRIFLGLIFIVFNLVFSFILNKEITKTNKLWGYVLMIYPLWLSIATCLNMAIWVLN